jgi:hypothetical protein
VTAAPAQGGHRRTALSALAKAGGLVTAVGLQAHVNPALMHMKEEVEAGFVGGLWWTMCFIVAAQGVGMCQDVVAADLVVQSVKPVAGVRLRFRV